MNASRLDFSMKTIIFTPSSSKNYIAPPPAICHYVLLNHLFPVCLILPLVKIYYSFTFHFPFFFLFCFFLLNPFLCCFHHKLSDLYQNKGPITLMLHDIQNILSWILFFLLQGCRKSPFCTHIS